jgi:CheY-like chemotaxis protein
VKKILIVSSSKSFLERGRNLLTGKDFQVITAQSGAEALQLQKEYLFDLVLSDLHLLDMGGDALSSALRSEKISRNVFIILICYDNADEHSRIARCGADAKINRPVKPEQIIETVGSLLDMEIGRPKRALFTVRVLSKKGEEKFDGISIDISITGILLETEHTLAIGDRIICQFTLPGGSQIEIVGDVARSVKILENIYKYGIQFVDLSLSSRKEIVSYVTSIRNKTASKSQI